MRGSATLLAFAAFACSSDALPPLGDEPSGEDISKHAALHCGRVQSCAPAEQVYAECMEKLQSHVSTPQDRRQTAAFLNQFEPCLALDCVPMTVCFTQVPLKMMGERSGRASKPAE